MLAYCKCQYLLGDSPIVLCHFASADILMTFLLEGSQDNRKDVMEVEGRQEMDVCGQERVCSAFVQRLKQWIYCFYFRHICRDKSLWTTGFTVLNADV